MQTVSTDNEVKSACRCVAEDDVNAVGVLGELRNGVIEEIFHLVADSAVEQVNEVAAEDLDLRDEPLPVEIVRADGRPTAAVFVYPGDAGLFEANAAGIFKHAHAFDHGAPCATQIHRLSACARSRRDLDDSNGEAVVA